MNGDVIALGVLLVLYAVFFAWLAWTSPARRHPVEREPPLTDPIDLELQRILDGKK